MISWIIIIVMSLLLALSLYFNYRHARVIIDTEDALSKALDVMDEGYKSMSNLLDIPVMFDSPEIKQVIFHIKRMRDSILYVSNILAEPFGGVIEELEEEEESGSS